MVLGGIATGGYGRGYLIILLCWGERERGGMGARPTLRPLKDHEVSALPEAEKAQQREWAPFLGVHSEPARRAGAKRRRGHTAHPAFGTESIATAASPPLRLHFTPYSLNHANARFQPSSASAFR